MNRAIYFGGSPGSNILGARRFPLTVLRDRIGAFVRRAYSAAAVLARRLADAIAVWMRRRRLRNQLAGMPANILDDIGVNPSDVDGAVERFLGTAGDENRPHTA